MSRLPLAAKLRCFWATLLFVAFGVSTCARTSANSAVRCGRNWPAALLLLLMTSGCTPVQSLQPIYTSRDALKDEGIEGAWEEVNAKEQMLWVFQPDGDAGYRLSVIAGSERALSFSVHMVRINGNLFLDLSPVISDAADPFAIATHMPGRIQIERDELKIRMLAADWVTDRVKASQLGVSYGITSEKDSRVILTAATPQLQEFLAANALNDEAFAPELRLRRWK